MRSNHLVKNNEGKSKIALVIFTILVILSGWIGRGIDKQMNASGENTLGMLIWILIPLLTVIVIKATKSSTSKIGLKPKFKGNIRLYISSFLFYPLVIAGYLVIGSISGFISFDAFEPETFIPIFITLLVSQSIKNIFEEFSWRGYLAPELYELKCNRYLSHVVVGIIWAAWHIPYNHTFIDMYRTTTTIGYYPAFFLGIVLTSFVYGEIRYRVGSVWPAVIMHTFGNTVSSALILSGLLNIEKADNLFFSIGAEGLIMTGLIVLLGFLILALGSMKKNTQTI